MRVRLKKEIRELFPTLAMTLAVIAFPLGSLGSRGEVFTFVGVLLGCAAMGGISFGAEFQRKTLSVLLSQPLSRRAIWMEKMLVLGVALGTVAACALLLRLSVFHAQNDDLIPLLIVPVCVFAGAPVLTLLTHNGFAGSVFAMALPGGLLALLVTILPGAWLEDRSLGVVPLGVVIMMGALVLYCLSGFLLGYKYFCSMQVIEDSGGTELKLPSVVEKWLSKADRQRATRIRVARPTLTLFKKEVRLQQVSILTAGVFVTLASAGMLVKWARPESPWAELMLGSSFLVYCCILPLLVGALAFAEERSLGIAEWQLTLPASTRTQWFAKLGTTLLVSFLLGLLVPGGLLYVVWLLSGSPTNSFPPTGVILVICLGQLLFMTLAAYAGSFSSSALKAILFPVAVVGAGVLVAKLVTWLLIGGNRRSWSEHPWFPEWAYLGACIVVLLCLFQWFCFSSFRRGGHGTRRILAGLAVALAVLGVMVALFCNRYTA